MIYSQQFRIVFAHVSRTGGTTIAESLRRLLPDCRELPGQHQPLAAARPLLGDLFDESFKFAFVRNPWDRFVSWYALIGQTTHGAETDRAALVDPESEHWKGFDAFLESWSAEEFQMDGVVRRGLSQWAQLSDAEGRLLTDDFGRFETLVEDAARLFAKAGISCPPLPTTNPSHHHHYSLYYSDFGRELIEHVFRKDVEQFGYRFENSDGKTCCSPTPRTSANVANKWLQKVNPLPTPGASSVISDKRLPTASSLDKSPLGVLHVARFLEAATLRRDNELDPEYHAHEWDKDRLLMDGLELGFEQTIQFVYQFAPSVSEFEAWVLDKHGGDLDTQVIERVNRGILACEGKMPAVAAKQSDEKPVLSRADRECWEVNGYVVVCDALPPQNCQAAERAIWEQLDASPDDPETWYQLPSIMVPLYRHPALDRNRTVPRIRTAFAEIWGTDELFVSCDRVSFNPPERSDWQFPGPNLHWDVDLIPPVPFGVQGLLYLTDTPAAQGAFTCVPGFHHKIDKWLRGLPPGTDPQQQDLHALGPVPLAGRAGDLVIWHHALPHGSRPNLATRPRLVQYINMYPIVK